MTPSGNPIVDHLDQKLSEVDPLARAAIQKAFSAPTAPVESAPGGVQSLAGFPGREQFHDSPFGVSSSLPQNSPTGAQPAAPAPLARAGGMASPLPPGPYEAPQPSPAHQRLADAQQPHGTAGIKSPWLRIPLQVLEGIGTGLAPGVAAAIPGSQLHSALAREAAQHGVEAETAEQDAATKRAQMEAQTAHLGAQTHEIENPTPPADEFSTLPGESGYGAFNKRTGSVTPLTVGGKPFEPVRKEVADKELSRIQDDEGHLWREHPDGSVTPIMANGKQLKGKASAEPKIDDKEKFVQQFLKEKNLPESATTRGQALQEYAKASQAPQRDPIVNVNTETGRLDRETAQFGTPYQKALDAANETLEKVDSAKAMLSQGAIGQALEIPKILTAVVGGKGTNVRITEPEMNRILGARGWGGSIEAWLSKAVGNGDLSTQQKQEIARVLDEVRTTVARKQAIANDTLDKMRGAKSREEIIAADKAARSQLAGGGNANSGAAVAHFSEGGDSWDIPADKVAAFKAKHPNAKAQ